MLPLPYTNYLSKNWFAVRHGLDISFRFGNSGPVIAGDLMVLGCYWIPFGYLRSPRCWNSTNGYDGVCFSLHSTLASKMLLIFHCSW